MEAEPAARQPSSPAHTHLLAPSSSAPPQPPPHLERPPAVGERFNYCTLVSPPARKHITSQTIQPEPAL